MRTAPHLLILVVLGMSTGRSLAGSSSDGPKPPDDTAVKATDEAPIPIFLNAPTDLEAFWKMLSRPDFVILDGDLYRKLRRASEPTTPSASNPPAVVESVAITGEVSGEWARLVAEFRVSLAKDGPAWVPIHLDGLTLSGARDGPAEVATRIADGRAWQVELAGDREHVVRVDFLAPVRSTSEGRRLDLAVPPVASTRIDLVVPRTVLDARTAVDEQVAVAPLEAGTGARLAARLGPRPRIELAWRERADPSVTLPALLSAQGEIAVEIERGSIRTRSSWVVGSIRGLSSQLTLRLDPAEELLDVEVDNRPVLVETRRDGEWSVVSIPLAEPLRPGTTRNVLLTTRRPIASSGIVKASLQGYSFDQAKVQTGVIAVARSGPLFLKPNPGRGLRRIDPWTELPETLRARPDTSLAFEFNDQPFELGLGIEPAPPRLRVESWTTVTVAPRSARLQTRLDCRTSQGRVFEVQVVLPRGLEFEGAEPPEVVESAQAVPIDPKADASVVADVPRILTVALTHQARESGAFTILLKGWGAIDPSGPVALPLFRPVVDSTAGGRFAVVTGRDVAVELAPGPEEPTAFRVDWGPPPDDWTWPAGRPGPELDLTWLRSDANPEALPMKVTVRPRTIRHESSLAASVDLRGVEVVEEISGEVAFGALSRLDVAIPREIPARWDVEGVGLAGREPLGQDPDGSRRYRLRFARDFTDAFRFRVRYRLPFAEPPRADREGRIRLSPIRVLEGTSAGQKVVISAEPGLDLRSESAGWGAIASGDPSTAPEAGPAARLSMSRRDEDAGPVEIAVRPVPELTMPSVVVSRLWLRTVQRLENDLAASAQLRVETRDGSIVVGLPAGSTWIRARVGSTELAEGAVETVAADEYRLRFPGTTPAGPVLVAIDYSVPASSTAGGWPPLRLLGGGVIQQTMWEVQVLGTRAGVGTPPGWTDENEWYWTGGLWRRRPWKGPLELSNWLAGGGARQKLTEPLDSGEQSGRQSYLFSRVGPPTILRFPVFSRFLLLLLCSGPVLIVGLLALARRPPPRMVAASTLILAFAAGALFEPDALILVLQSSALGVALLLAGLAMHWAIERRGHSGPAGDRAVVVGPASVGSSMAQSPPIGVDESTAIRPRPTGPSAISTADHVFLARSPGRPPDELSASDLGHR